MNYLGIISAVSEHNRHLSKEPTLNCSFRYFATSSLPQESMIRSPFFSWIFKNTKDWAGKVDDEQQEKKKPTAHGQHVKFISLRKKL